MNQKKNEKGITLVALVVTIIILLILAGITITYVLGDNGIIRLAQDAKNKTEEGMKKELDDLENLVNELKENGGESGNKITKEGRAVQKFFYDEGSGTFEREIEKFENDEIEVGIDFNDWTIYATVSNKLTSNSYFIRMKAIVPTNVQVEIRDGDSGGLWMDGGDGYWYWNSELEGGASTGMIDYRISIPEEIEEFSVSVVIEYTPVQYDEEGNPFANWDL